MHDKGWVDGKVRESVDGLRGRGSQEQQQEAMREARAAEAAKAEKRPAGERRDDD